MLTLVKKLLHSCCWTGPTCWLVGLTSSVCLCVSERVGGAGDRGTQVGLGERGGGADVQRPELRNLLQSGPQVHHVLKYREPASSGTSANASELSRPERRFWTSSHKSSDWSAPSGTLFTVCLLGASKFRSTSCLQKSKPWSKSAALQFYNINVKMMIQCQELQLPVAHVPLFSVRNINTSLLNDVTCR